MKQVTVIVGISILMLLSVFLMQNCKPNQDSFSNISQEENKYMGDAACKNCHAGQYNDWLKSDHFKAMQLPTDSSVLGNFNNASFSADGVHASFFKKNNQFIVNTQGDDGLNHDYEVKYVFGHYPLQQYLIEFPNGKLQATRESWDSKEHKWFHQYAGKKIDYHDWLHWTGNAQNWNTMCAECHSTNLKKNYDIASDTYKTSFDVINVSCESCHGAGKKHIDYINSPEYKTGNRVGDAFILLKKNSTQLSQINTCAPCHSVKSNLSANPTVSDELLDNFIPTIPNTERFYADGQVNDEDYTYASFLQSKMYHRNVMCSNCHNPHSEKLKLPGNQLCLQCHAKTLDDPSHFFHQVGSTGAQCVNCHMPGKYYMGNDFRHDHSFRIPRPDLSVQYGTPNACNNCHKDKSATWAADAVNKWYGTRRKYHFSEDLIPGSKMDANSESHLVKLLGDTAVPNIIKATAVNYLGGIHTETSVRKLLEALNNSNAQIRYESLRSLANFPPDAWQNAVPPLLNDKVKAVRIAAADLLLLIPTSQIPSEYSNAFSKAKMELEAFLMNQADFAHGNINIAEYYFKQKDYGNTERFYKRALKKDSLANLVRLNLATVYNTEGKNQEAIFILSEAGRVDPKNPEIYFKRGLLLHEIKQDKEAESNFQTALTLKSDNPRLYYNYGLLLQQKGELTKAINVLETGLSIHKEDASINYALAYIYLSNHQPDKAFPYGRVLKSLDPNNSDYQQIFEALHLN